MITLITGATGFIGSALVDRLTTCSNLTPRAVVRRANHHFRPTIATVQVRGLYPDTDWSIALQGVDAVVHAAARVHIMRDTALDPLTEFCNVNTDGTLNLARQAAAAGVRRFVFISSIKVNGETTTPGQPFSADDKFVPSDPYGLSKYQAEQGLLKLAGNSGMEVVIIRPPLVYGPGVKANFLRLLQIVDRRLPLPLSSINNARSLVSLSNLVDLLITCLIHPGAAGKTFLVSDGKDLSTPDLIKKIARFMNRPSLLLPFPPKLLRFMGKLIGKEAVVDRLCGSLQVDISKAKNVLDWQPPLTVDEELRKTVAWYMRKK